MICHHTLVLTRENKTEKLARLKVRKCPVSCTEAVGTYPIWDTTSIFRDLEICDFIIPIFPKENYLSHSENIKV